MSSELDSDQYAYWHSYETRALPMPDGSTRMFRQKRIYWGSFDFLTLHWFTEEKLVGLLVKDAEENKADLDENFGNCVAWLDREYHKIHGIPYE